MNNKGLMKICIHFSLRVITCVILCYVIGCGRYDESIDEIEKPIAVESLRLEEIQTSKEEEADLPEESIKEEESEETDLPEESIKDGQGKEEESYRETSEVTLVMVGDVLMHTPVTESGLAEDGTYHYDHLFAHVKNLIEDADIAIVNQEVILGGTELGLSGYPTFNAPYEVGDALADAGFDVVLHATNHALDKGEKGIRNCLAFWQQFHPEMKVVGIHPDQESYDDVTFIEQHGIKIAILNYTYGTNGIALPKDAHYIVDLLDREKIAEDVEKAKEEADFVVLCPHWGTEYRLEPDASQKEWASYFADLGVDLVIGAHPHVIEPVEWVKVASDAEDVRIDPNKMDISETDKKTGMLVYYSLGNFVNATSGVGDGVANRMLGSMAIVHITRVDDKVIISENESIPLVSHLEHGYGNITVYPLEQYTQELASKNWIVEQDGNFSLEYLQNLWKRVMKP